MTRDLEKKLKTLKADEQNAINLLKIGMNVSSYLFEKEEKENNRLKKFLYLFFATRFQNRAIWYSNQANKLSNEYFKVRGELRSQIQRDAELLGCKVRFEYPKV